MNLTFEFYSAQIEHWPEKGRHILAQYDADSIIVYQAYSADIARYAIDHGQFGGDFSFNRMSWIKTNFLWMMYRSGWGTKANQEITLAIRLKRDRFDEILRQAVHTQFVPKIYGTLANYNAVAAHTPVRLQWDPDHNPAGNPVERRAIQLGLRGETLEHYASDWIIELCDISEFVAQQRQNTGKLRWNYLFLPQERVYPVENSDTSQKLGLSAINQKD